MIKKKFGLCSDVAADRAQGACDAPDPNRLRDGRDKMNSLKTGWRLFAAAAVALGLCAQAGSASADKYKIFLSMSYIGNDWQAEAANMVKAMAASKDMADKVDLQVQVAGPNAQRQIQQINAMVQAGAKAIVVYPISPTALNAAVKNACDKGVMIIAYDANISEPCAYNVSIDQEGLRQEPGHQDRRRGGRHVEPGGCPDRALEDSRHP
jgi:hypothetical protein